MSATILIVDDDWMNREMMQAHLESAGYTVLTANSGTKGLELLASNPVDLLLLDVRMPGLNGYEVCARLKSADATRNIPVLLMTALDDEVSKTQGVEAGADDFVAKPYDMMIVQTRIRSLLRIKALYDEMNRRDQILWNVLNQHLKPDAAQAIMESYSRTAQT